MLTCHPYEPCLYITDKKGGLTTVHNSFDPSVLLEEFSKAKIVTSITGREYDVKDFCRMVEYAAGMYDISISDAEKVFQGNLKKKMSEPIKGNEKVSLSGTVPDSLSCSIIEEDPFYDLLEEYPSCAVDYCIVKAEHGHEGVEEHRLALLSASRKLFTDEENGEIIWNFDIDKAAAVRISTEELFSLSEESRKEKDYRRVGDVVFFNQVTDGGRRSYRQAFLLPPSAGPYSERDFRKVNAALFPKGTDELEIYEWTTDWSEYFDEGREWWGTLCVTAYDKSLDRFVVIMASATD